MTPLVGVLIEMNESDEGETSLVPPRRGHRDDPVIRSLPLLLRSQHEERFSGLRSTKCAQLDEPNIGCSRVLRLGTHLTELDHSESVRKPC